MTDKQKKDLILRQVKTMEILLEHGAISREQFEFSYNGLVTKMGVTDKELAEWKKQST